MAGRFRKLTAAGVPRSLYAAINRQVGQALAQYEMLEDGDRVAVGVSGGKDSLALYWILQERLARIPIKYEICAIHVNPGFEGGDSGKLFEWFNGRGWPLKVADENFGPLAHSEENRENPCFLCSRLRRKRLFEMAKELGCNKLALGHHKDDIIETFFINVCYAGEIATMRPKQEFFKGAFTVIRPLAFVEEARIARFSGSMNFPEFHMACPSSKISKRGEIKGLLDTLYRSNRKIRGNIFRALGNVRPDYLLL